MSTGKYSPPKPLTEEEKKLSVVYCFMMKAMGEGESARVVSLSQDGDIFFNSICSNIGDGMRKVGYIGTGLHELYKVRYPQGCRVEWIHDPTTHEGVDKSMDLATLKEGMVGFRGPQVLSHHPEETSLVEGGSKGAVIPVEGENHANPENKEA